MLMSTFDWNNNRISAGKSTTAVDLFIDQDPKWRHLKRGPTVLWRAGHIEGVSDAALSEALAKAGPDIDVLRHFISGLAGHFALLLQTPDWTLACVDNIRSIPLFYGCRCGKWQVATKAETLLHRLDLTASDIDADQALAFSMSGYAFADRTLYSGLNELVAGECVLFTGGNAPMRAQHHVYRPWLAEPESENDLIAKLSDLTRAGFENLIKGLDGRTVVVPLSAGLDSRLIASALSHLGYRNVQLFAYGLPNNFEAIASQKIAQHLEYPWTFIPLTPAGQRDSFRSEGFRSYMRYAESYSSLPFQQEYLAFRMLIDSKQVPNDAIIINGQSGDFITGNHIPANFGSGPIPKPASAIVSALIDKHYSLWECLKTPERLDRLTTLLIEDMRAIEAPIDAAEWAWAAFEASEYRNRQAKYVANGQRLYEFFEFDWRLPLWDRAFVDFWERVPVGQKLSQQLYKKYLMEQNWAGVWKGWHFPQTVSPTWIRPLRLAAKVAHAPFGRRAWHRFEKNWFEYWTDVVGNYAIVPYAKVKCDRRGHRNAISWHVEAYLNTLGLRFDGRPVAEN